MSALWVPTSTGQFVKASALWVANADGVFQPVKNAWSTDASGQYAKFWPAGVSAGTVTVDKGTPPYQKLVINWLGTGAAKYELRQSGSTTVLYSGTGTTYTFTGVPSTKYTFTVRAIALDGSFSDSAPVSATLDALPAPTNFRRTTGTSTSSTFAWNAVTAASNYEVVDTLVANTPTRWSGPGLLAVENSLHASTTYERAVRARLSTASSGLSNKVRYTTPAPSSSPAGTYEFRATRAVAWAPGRNAWRPDSDGIIHGNGDIWGASNGNQITLFFYDLNAIRALFGRVTRFKIRIRRDSSAGYSAPQANHFTAHTFASRPAGSPNSGLGAATNSGSLAWGKEGVFDLPVAWGQWMVDSYLNMGGIAWGGATNQYMRGAGLAGYADQGRLYITIG